ncbi:M61 family metallopeptidase [Eikenella sp. S3360]|uniref:M61 family metallopeptidase n=1 Tax=Eikenella glucosivorans TaxID=2766967 RepID=A0ABS0NBY7_9NEIS|nr:PDZ domain-containing protein [Eikenella glucosivorans]MBH5329801.1 M61 family metallopeptidase [Eikenella glucosivorans]
MPHYTITPLPQQHLFQIQLRFSHSSQEPVRLTLPNWVPGSYMIREFARHVVHIEASCNGQPAELQAINKNTWQSAQTGQGDWLVEYHVYAFDLSVRGCYLDNERAFFDGAALFFQVASHSEEPHQVELHFPAHWQTATALPRLSGSSLYQARHYRHLIDCPLEAGSLEILEFTAAGIPHRLVLSGHYPDFDRQRLLADTQAICAAQLQFFPSPAPFEHYTFLLHLGGHIYGGLEHSNSTALLADRSWLPEKNSSTASSNYSQLLGLISHEYFHAWNVKSIKPAALAQSDLNQEAYTRLLWAFEGITSYYDDLFLVRSGRISPADYLEQLAHTLTCVRRNPGRRQQTLAQSSFHAWDKYYKQNENSPNAITSYYQQGALAALCLDLAIRQRSPHSLDTVMQALYQDWLARQSPLAETEWEEFAQHITGLDLSELFDHLIRSTRDLPLESCLATAGIRLHWLPLPPSHKGGCGSLPAVSPANDFGARFQQNSSDITLSHVLTGGSAEQAGLAPGDRIVALNRYSTTDFAQQWQQQTPGSQVELHYFRHGVLHRTQATVQAARADTAWLTIENPAALDAWLQPAPAFSGSLQTP